MRAASRAALAVFHFLYVTPDARKTITRDRERRGTGRASAGDSPSLAVREKKAGAMTPRLRCDGAASSLGSRRCAGSQFYPGAAM